jgi:flagellar assembly factor FliW
MKVQTKWFGEIEVSEDKIITFDKGIIGFEDWRKYTLVYDAEKEEKNSFTILYTCIINKSVI